MVAGGFFFKKKKKVGGVDSTPPPNFEIGLRDSRDAPPGGIRLPTPTDRRVNRSADSRATNINFFFSRMASDSQMGAGVGRFWRNDSQNGGLGVGPPFLGSRFSKPLFIIENIFYMYCLGMRYCNPMVMILDK